MTKYKLVLFDMDGTLIKDRGIFVIAEKKGFVKDLLMYIKDKKLEYYERSIVIASLSKGFTKNEFLEIFRKIPYQDNIKGIIKNLKEKNIITAIATDSYKFLADDLKKRLGIDYAFANNLKTNNNIITGDLEIHNKELFKDFISGRIYSICKSRILEQLCNDLNINLQESIAIGDGIVDIGMIKKAGLGIAINGSNEVRKYADIVIDDMKKILEYI
jgi:phosphoserine phosphatase